mmetsp:Transcript_22684/g.26039  ORF Transcript_22684/g.26039 Transcript_22684/m.26039 type:complete len:82 (-) Transcript_22684:138-383(-)
MITGKQLGHGDFNRLLRENPKICTLVNEIDPSLNGYNNLFEWNKRYLEFYNKTYGHRKRFRYFIAASTVGIAMTYLLYFRI